MSDGSSLLDNVHCAAGIDPSIAAWCVVTDLRGNRLTPVVASSLVPMLRLKRGSWTSLDLPLIGASRVAIRPAEVRPGPPA